MKYVFISSKALFVLEIFTFFYFIFHSFSLPAIDLELDPR